MRPQMGAKLKDKHVDTWLGGLANHLLPGEEVVVLAKTSLMRPMCDGIAITNARIASFYGQDVASRGAPRQVMADEIDRLEVRKKFGGKSLIITTKVGDELNFGSLADADIDLVQRAGQRLAATGIPADIHAARSAYDLQQAQSAEAWKQVEILGEKPSEKAWKTIKDHVTPGEVPWFVIGVGSGGVFAAFDDRCMIIKVGVMTSLMAGSLGGGRITIFHYSEITGIEYNAGFLNGVLEVLTPSYQGTANKDFWRGSNKSRNADSNDPWTLSNCLPMAKPIYQSALPRLNEMRARIAESKRSTVVVEPTAAQSPETRGLAEELERLAGLRDRGVLDELEFAAAKKAALAKYTGS